MQILLWIHIDSLEDLNHVITYGFLKRENGTIFIYHASQSSEHVCVSIPYSTYLDIINNPNCQSIDA
jgi:hypothetical protein